MLRPLNRFQVYSFFCTISHKGLNFHKLSTFSISKFAPKLISFSVVKRPIPILNEVCTSSSFTPSALKT